MKEHSKTSELIGGAMALTVSALIVKLLGVIYKIPLSYILTEEGMGYFNSAYTVYTFFYLICTAGVPKAISILTSESMSEGNAEKCDFIYKRSLRIFGGFGAFISIVFLVFAGLLSVMIGSSNAVYSMLAIAPSVFFVCLSGVIRGALNGRLKFIPVAVSEVISGALRVGLGLLLAFLGYRLGMSFEVISALTILGTTVGSVISCIYLLIWEKSHNRHVNTRQNEYVFLSEKDITKRITSIAIPLTLTSAVSSISGIIDLSIIMRRLQSSGYSELQSGMLYGNYTTLVIPMLNLAATLIAPLSAILLPTVSRCDIKNDRASLSEKLSMSVRVSAMIAVPISAVFMYYGNDVLSFLFEDSSAAMAAPMLSIAAPGVFFMALLTVINTVLEGSGNTQIPLVSMVFGTAVKLTVSYILIGIESIGIFGAAMGSSVSYIVSFMVSYVYAVAVLRLDIHLISSAAIPIALACVSLALTSAISRSFYASGTAFSILSPALFTIFYAVLLLIYLLFDKKIAKSMSFCTKIRKKNY